MSNSTINMLPPPELAYPDTTTLMDAVRDFGHSQGYAVSKLRSDKEKVVIKCDRGGRFVSKAASNHEKKRESASRLIECPFQLIARIQKDGSWKLRTVTAEHNHEPSYDISGHPSARRLRSPQRKLTRQLLKAGIAPKQILTSLRQNNPNQLAIGRTIYNERRKCKDEELMGRLPIEVLLDELHQARWNPQVKMDDNNKLTHLFYSSPQSINLLERYPYTLVMDCTYKTNRFNLPLVHIIGMTSFNTSFSVAFAFIKKECIDDYKWVLEKLIDLCAGRLPITLTTDRDLALIASIEATMPSVAHILCVWHIQKNVLANCRRYFGNDEDWSNFLRTWTTIIQAPSTLAYEDSLGVLRETYASIPLLLNYLQNTWLVYKEKFVNAYTNNHLHFGNLTSSRVEGLHFMIKSYIQVSTRDLRDVHARITHAINAQVSAHNSQLSQERTRVFHKHRLPLFNQVVCHISSYALNITLEQYNLIRERSHTACRRILSRTMGLPCCHRILELLENSQSLTTGDFHPIWHLDIASQGSIGVEQMIMSPSLNVVREPYENLGPLQRSQTVDQLDQYSTLNAVPVSNPDVQRPRGRPSGSTSSRFRSAHQFYNSSSNRRDLSGFELAIASSRERRCAICRETGHNIRTCPQRTVFQA